MAYVNPSTFVAGEVLTAAQQNVLANNIRFLHGPPTVRTRRTSQQTIPTATVRAIEFNQEDWDNNTIWSSTASAKFFARTAGKYQANFSVWLAGSSAGQFRSAGIAKNTTSFGETSEVIEHEVNSTAIESDWSLTVSGMFSLTTSDYLSAQVFQDAGVNMLTSTSLRRQPKFSMFWVSS